MLLWGVVQESRARAGSGGEGWVDGGWGCRGGGRAGRGCGAGGVAVAQEAGGGGGVRVLLLKGGLGVLAVGRAVVQVRAGADGGGNLSGQHQAGLHKGLWVDIRLSQPAHRHKDQTEEGRGGWRLDGGAATAE